MPCSDGEGTEGLACCFARRQSQVCRLPDEPALRPSPRCAPGPYVGDGAPVGDGALGRYPRARDALADASSWNRAQGRAWKTGHTGVEVYGLTTGPGPPRWGSWWPASPPPNAHTEGPPALKGEEGNCGRELLSRFGERAPHSCCGPHLSARTSPGPWAPPGSPVAQPGPVGTAAPASRH